MQISKFYNIHLLAYDLSCTNYCIKF